MSPSSSSIPFRFSSSGRKSAMTVQAAADGPVCVVTGASRGIGAAIATQLGAQGCRVVVNYAASSGPAEEVCKTIKASGGDAIAVQANVAKQEEVDALFKAAVDAFGEVNVW